jgi:uncharacterized protein (DUF1697 family)
MRRAALLGSINVGGNRVKMADLRDALTRAGLTNVATIVASGNVLFDHNGDNETQLASLIEAVVKDRFGFATFAAVRTKTEIVAAIADNPFTSDAEPKFVHTVFLEHPINPALVGAFAASFEGVERIAGGERTLFIDYSGGVARSEIDPALKKAKLISGRATARNIRSLRRIADAMGD